MNKICTSIDQSKKLIELGIDVNTADMFWDTAEPLERIVPTVGSISDYYDMEDWAIPAWSLSALTDILSKQDFIIKSLERNNEYQYNIDIPIRHCKIWFSSLLDAAFEMVCWLKENNKL